MDINFICFELPVEFGQILKLQELLLANSPYCDNFQTIFLSLELNHVAASKQLINPPMSTANLSKIYYLNLSKNLLSGEISFDSSFLKRLCKNLNLSENI
ncbi:hypothetical protein R6Q59_021196 [Mikania micrantha]